MTSMAQLRDILNDTPANAVDVNWNFQTLESFVSTELINRDGTVPMSAPLTLAGPAPSSPTHAATKGYVDAHTPLGTITMYAGSAAPAGWALCDGSSKSTTDPAYAALFAVIQYAYGGSGANFNLPDLRARFPVGRSAGDALFGTVNNKGGSRDVPLNAHTHTTPAHQHTVPQHNHTASSGGQSGPHNHGGTTAPAGVHNHNTGGGLTWGLFGAGTLGMDTSGTGHTGAPSNLGDISTQPDHTHDFSTGTNNVDHTHAIAVSPQAAFMTNAGEGGGNTGNGGAGTGVNANMPPYIAINFLIRIGV